MVLPRNFTIYWCFLSLVILPSSMDGLPQVVRIGGIFPEEYKGTPVEVAFKYAVYSVNRERKLLGNNTTLVYRTLYFSNNDLFKLTKTSCQLIDGGISALFAVGVDRPMADHLKSIAFTFDLPLYLPTSSTFDHDFFEPFARSAAGSSSATTGSSTGGGSESSAGRSSSNPTLLPHDDEYRYNAFPIKLSPTRTLLTLALREAVQFLNWTRVALIYEDWETLFEIEYLVHRFEAGPSPYQSMVMPSLKTGLSSKRSELFARGTNPSTYRNVLKEIRRRKIFHVIVALQHLPLFFRMVLQLQMNDPRYHYHFNTLDLDMYDLEDFAYNNVNITSFRLADHSPANLKVIQDMQRFNAKGYAKAIQTDAALVYDSVLSFCHGLKSFDASHQMRPFNISCEKEQPWPDGLSLLNYINSVSFDGLTGRTQVREGSRHDPKLSFTKLKARSLQSVGEWSPLTKLKISDYEAFSHPDYINVTLRVTTLLEKPYVMLKSDAANLSGNARYEGFCIDLLNDVANVVGFHFSLHTVVDGKYGVEDPDTKEWNGIVRELLDGRSDLAVGSMTINSAREKVIDFTKPFRNVGISILFKLPKKPPPRLFSFLRPLSAEIYAWVAGAYVLVCFCLFVVARFTPDEWLEPLPSSNSADGGDEGVLENQFSLSNSVWFITGTFLCQGSGLNPKATSTRLVGGIWWFFTFIIVSSYTANLAAFLTVDRKSTPIESASDLASQTDISYGTLESGSTMEFFRNSTVTTYKTMWSYMEGNPAVFVQSYDAGIKRVLQGNYAFLIESPMLDYAVQRDCNLTQIGATLDSKGYGIGMPKGSPWRDKLSLAILELQEKGITQLRYNKWWKNTGDVCNRDDKKNSRAFPLSIDNIGGVFLILCAGLATALVVALCEFCCHVRRKRRENKSGVCSELRGELSRALSCCKEERESEDEENYEDEPNETEVVPNFVSHRTLTTTNRRPASISVPKRGRKVARGHHHHRHPPYSPTDSSPSGQIFELRKASFQSEFNS